MFGTTTVKVPQLLLACQTTLGNRLSFKNWYHVNLGSTSIIDAFRHPPNQSFWYINFPSFTVSNGVSFLQIIEANDKG